MSVVTSQAEYDDRYPNVPLERWRNNVVRAAVMVGDANHQEQNWLRDDRPAWENPNEVINVLIDDCLFDLFLADCDYSFTDIQRVAAQEFSNNLHSFLDQAPQSLDPLETLRDHKWKETRVAARKFVTAFTSS
jgi:hypothetical protein